MLGIWDDLALMWYHIYVIILYFGMMMLSNENIFRVTGPLCGDSPVTGKFPAQRPMTRSFDVFFDLRPNKRLSKQSWDWWFAHFDVIVFWWAD